ncbi:MAG: hypothetical protein V1875_05810 [Candidatus Altiarchaeota archaeon]
MDFRLILLEPGRFLEGDAARMRAGNLALFLLGFSLIFWLLHGLDFYAFGNSKIGYLIDMPSGKIGPPKYDILAVSLRAGFNAAVVRLLAVVALAAFTHLPMRLLGSKARFKDVFAPAAVLLVFPAIITSFSVGLNLLSYLILGNVSVLNSSVTAVAGWLTYSILFAGAVRKTSGLTGWRGNIAVLPVAGFALLWVAWSCAAVWFNLVFIGRISESSLNGLIGGI